jgi:hypothetical protein
MAQKSVQSHTYKSVPARPWFCFAHKLQTNDKSLLILHKTTIFIIFPKILAKIVAFFQKAENESKSANVLTII